MTRSAAARWFRDGKRRPPRARLFVEQLGERIVPSTLIPITNHRDLVFDATRNQLDITTSAGTVQVFDVANQALLTPLTVGTSLNGADISPDGSTLYVTEGQTTSVQGVQTGVLHQVNLTTGAVTNLTYPLAFAEGGSFDVAVGPGSKGLFDGQFNGSGWVPLRQVDLSTGALSIRNDDPGSGGGGYVRQNAMIHRSADRSLFFFTESNISSGPVFAYNAVTDTFSKSSFNTNVFLDNALSAVNRNGTLIALEENGGVAVLNTNFGTVHTLSGLAGGAAFDPLRDMLYAVDTTRGQVDVYNTSTWSFEYALSIGLSSGETIGSGTALGNGVMAVSADGSELFLATSAGVRELSNPSYPATGLSFRVPESSVAGTPFSFTVTAHDTYGNLAVGYRGTIHFTSSDPQAVLPPDYTFTAADAGAHTITGVTLYTASPYYPGQSVKATDTATSSLSWSSYDRVQPAAASRYQLSAPAAVAAGSPFAVTLTAFDPYGNVATYYTGTARFTSSDGQATLPADYTFVYYDRGRHTFTSAVTFNTLGSQTVTATDAANGSMIATAATTVNPEPAGLHFTVSPSVTTTAAGSAFDVTVTALDGGGNVATGYTGTVTFATSDAGSRVVLPAPYTFTSADAGVHTFAAGATLVTAGSQTVTAFDRGITDGSSAGSATVQVNPIAANQFAVAGFPSPITAGVPGTFTVTARDTYGNVATGYTGTIHFTSSDFQAALPGDYTFTQADAGVQTFTATLKTVPSQSQSLTATDTKTSINGTQFRIVVTPSSATHFAFTLQGPLTAGVAGVFLLTALDAYGNEATGYRGTVHFTSTDPQAGLPSDYTFTTADNGQHAFSNLVLKTAGNQTLTGTDTANNSVTGNKTVTVVAGPVALVYAFPASSPLSTAAGQAFTATAQAQDAYGNVVTSFTGSVSWSSSDGQATLPATYTFTSGDAGVHTFANGFTLRTAGSQSVTATWPQGPNRPTSTFGDTVTPAAASRLRLGVPSGATAGSPFDVSATFFDPYGNVATGYTGTVHFTSSDGQATLPADYTFSAGDQGAHTFSKGVTLDTAGSQTVSVSGPAPGGGSLSDSAAVRITPAAASHFSVTAPASATAGSAFSATVTALDPFGNVDTNYAGTVHFSSSDGQATLPADYTFSANDQGARAFTNGVTLATAGSQAVTATDRANNSVTGSATVAVNPATPAAFRLTVPAATTAGSAFTIALAAVDAFGNVTPAYQGTAHFISSDAGAALPADYTFQASDGGTHTFTNGATLVTAGSQAVTASASGMSSATQSVAVSPAAAASLSLAAPSTATAGTAFGVTLTAHDAYGNVATGYTGTVHFTSSDTQATVPADYTFTANDAGTHTFSNGVTLDTAGNQTVTAADTAASSLTASAGVTVSAAAATHFRLLAPGAVTAGSAFTFTVTALDAFNNVATGYAGTAHFTSSDGQAVLPGDSTLTGGSGSFSATLETAGSQSLTATDTATASITGTQSGIAVSPATASRLRVSGPTAATAGTALTFSVTALDAFGNTASAYGGTVHFTSSDGRAALPADYTFTAADQGGHSFSVTLKTAGSQAVTATDAATSAITGTQSGIAVSPAAAASLVLAGFPAPTTAGTAHAFTVTARDAYGNLATGYTGAVHFTSSDGQAAPPADYTFTAADAGTRSFSATLKTAGSQSLTAIDTAVSALTATQSGIVVSPAAASALLLTGFPTSTTAGVAHTFTVTAQDPYGNVATGYAGAVHITSSDAQAALPADYTFAAADSGVHTFSATLKTVGSQSLTVMDTTTSALTVTQSGIAVSPAAAARLRVSGPTAATAGAALTFTVTALDAFGNTASAYGGTVHFTSSDGRAALPADYTFTAADQGGHSFSVTLKTAGSQAVTATDAATSAITGTQSGIAVSPAAAAALLVTGYPAATTAGTAHTLTVTAQDAYGNVATGYTGAVHFTSSDAQATLPADYTFTAADAGVHTFSATLKTAGSQSLSVTDKANSALTGKQSGIAVSPAAATTFLVTGYPAATTAGAAHSFTVTARDAYGNTATGYTGAVHFTSSDGQAALPADYTFTAADAGTHTFSATLKTAGSRSLTATDKATATITGTQSGILVSAAAATHLSISAPARVSAGAAFSIVVTALDAYGNVATGYTGKVHFTSSDRKAVLPADYTFVSGDAGAHTFTVTLRSSGTQTIAAQDTATSSISGNSTTTVSRG